MPTPGYINENDDPTREMKLKIEYKIINFKGTEHEVNGLYRLLITLNTSPGMHLGESSFIDVLKDSSDALYAYIYKDVSEILLIGENFGYDANFVTRKDNLFIVIWRFWTKNKPLIERDGIKAPVVGTIHVTFTYSYKDEDVNVT